MIHSPMPAICWPFHVPAGIAYRPQWMNSPNFASRNHFIFSSWDIGLAARTGRVTAPTAVAAAITHSRQEVHRVLRHIMVDLLSSPIEMITS